MNDNKLYDVPKFILEHYDMFMDTRMTIRQLDKKETLIIYSWIVFTPKEVNDFTPKTVNFFSEHEVTILNGKYTYQNISYEDASYIRKFEMPLLRYIQGEGDLDEFCEKLSFDKVIEIVNDFVSGKNIDVPLIFTVGNKIYHDYYKNNF